MMFVIAGAGNIGFYLTEILLDEGHEVIVIEKNKEVCKKISSELQIVVSNGDATDQKVLLSAGVKNCDAFVALTGTDETNMVASLLAKELGAKQVAARIGKVEYNDKVLQKLGIDIVIHPEAAAAGYIEELITKPEVLDLAFISRGSAEIMEIKVKEKSKIVGKKVKEIENPSGTAIVALYENNELVIPTPDTRILAGSKILVLAKREVADNVRKMLN